MAPWSDHRRRWCVLVLVLCAGWECLAWGQENAQALTGKSTPSAPSAPSAWAPAEIVAAQSDTQCSLPLVLNGVTARLNEMIENLLRFTATEKVEHYELSNSGTWNKPVEVQFEYTAEIEKISGGVLHMSETRDGGLAWNKFPSRVATLGIPSAVLALHPTLIDGYHVTCEGRGDWNGRSVWILYFEQRPDKVPRLRRYVDVHRREWLLKMKGRVWVDTETFNVVHIETDLMEPVPQIELYRDHLEIDYAPVHFSKQNEDLWLQRRAEAFVDFRRRRFRRVHEFSNFLLFSVDVGTKDTLPEAPPPEKQ